MYPCWKGNHGFMERRSLFHDFSILLKPVMLLTDIDREEGKCAGPKYVLTVQSVV